MKRKKSRQWKILFVVCLIIALILGLLGSHLLLGSLVREQTTLYIPSGSRFSQVCDSLSTNPDVGNITVFKLIAKCNDYDKQIKAGRYVLVRGTSTLNLWRKLRSGRQDAVKLRLHGVRTLPQLAGKICREMEVDSLSFLQLLQDSSYLSTYAIGQKKLNSQNVMACFVPNTYFVYWNLSPQEIFERMYGEQSSFWESEERLQKAAEMQYEPIDIITLASIVEEETRVDDEKPLVASVYLNRLKKGMPLQADPTVKFALGDFSLRRIRKEHTQTKSPYNTYQTRALPPGPICMPSISSIDAVLKNEKTPYYYFCANADFSGRHAFAANHSEHQNNARAYHRALNKRGIK